MAVATKRVNDAPKVQPASGVSEKVRRGSTGTQSLGVSGRYVTSPSFTVGLFPAARKRGGRKLVITPDGRTERPRPRVDSTLVKAIARAHRWQRLLESGECASVTELAAAEKIDRSYLCRVLRLTLLAPEIVEAIIDGWQAEAAIR